MCCRTKLLNYLLHFPRVSCSQLAVLAKRSDEAYYFIKNANSGLPTFPFYSVRWTYGSHRRAVGCCPRCVFVSPAPSCRAWRSSDAPAAADALHSRGSAADLFSTLFDEMFTSKPQSYHSFALKGYICAVLMHSHWESHLRNHALYYSMNSARWLPALGLTGRNWDIKFK